MKIKKDLQVFQYFLVIFFGCLCALMISETILRLFPRLNMQYSLDRFNYDDPRIRDLNRPDWHSTFRSSPILGYERIPNSAPEVNSYGMIGKEYPLRKTKDVFRILVLGDSITQFDFYVRILENLLNNANLSYTFELWNAGVTGYEVNQYANYLKFRGIHYNPDMILIGFCLNDFNIFGTLITYKNAKGFRGYYYSGNEFSRRIPIDNVLFTHSYLYRFIILSVDKVFAKFNQDYYINERIKTGETFLREIKNITLSRKIKLLAAVFPYLKPIDEYMDYQKEEYENMIRVLKGLDIDYIDLREAFPDGDEIKSLRIVDTDYIHPSEKGHAVAAEAIFNYMLKMGQ